MKPFFYCDFDNVLFDTDEFIRSIKSGLADQPQYNETTFDSLYNQHKKNITELCTRISREFGLPPKRIKNLFFNDNCNNFLKPDAREFLSFLKKHTELTITTTGDTAFQKHKIDSLCTYPEFEDIPTIISDDKTQEIARSIQTHLENTPDAKFIVMDDRASVLEKIWNQLDDETKKHIQCLRLKDGKYKEETIPPEMKSHVKEFPSLSGVQKECQNNLLLHSEATEPGRRC